MKRIMALIDFSDLTSAVVSLARDMARAFDCELALLHVAESESETTEDEVRDDVSTQASARRARNREMEILGVALKKEGINAVTQIVQAHSPGENVIGKILQEITRLSPDLIVVGSNGHGRLHHLFSGGVTDAVVRRAGRAALIVPSRKAEKAAL